jgi:hypothetical protein
MKSKLAGLALLVSLGLLIGGCSSQISNSDGADTSSIELPTISEGDFRKSLENVESEYYDFDELTDYFKITAARNDVSFIFANTLYDTGVIEPKIAVFYDAADWIFFDSWDIRSQGETYTIFSDINSAEKSTEVDNGVHELYMHHLTDEQVLLFKQIAADQDAKFRLLGSGGSVERQFTFEERSAIEDMIDVYLGLKQGLVP